MKKRYFVLIALGLIGYNLFLIQRDNALFEAYNQPTPKERYCKTLSPSQFHPDCNVE
jgi:hypothetical protein